MSAMANVLRVERRPASEEELESALKRILSVPACVYDGNEIVRILGAPVHGFEFKTREGQFHRIALLTKIVRENPNLEIGLIHEGVGKAKLVILNHKPTA